MAVAQRIYARALYEAAREHGTVADVREQLAELAAALEATPELAAFLSNPQLDPGAKRDVLDRLSEGASDLVRNFLRLVAEKGRAGELAAMSRELAAIVDRAEGRIAVELTTAYELSDQEAVAIVRQIEGASGRRVDATRTVEPGLIGGLILQVGSLRVDASVRGRIDGLRRELSGAGR
jgi:F-type H+-transporting ATPase subunit delta